MSSPAEKFSTGTDPTDSVRQDIDALRELVRLGLQPSIPDFLTDKAAARRLKREIERVLNRLQPRFETNDPGIVAEDVLAYRTLLAEIEFGLGRGDATRAEELRQYVNALDLHGDLQRWKQSRKLPVRRDGISARQRIWSLMSVAFFSDFARGDVRKALESLGRIGEFIDAAMPTNGEGTRVRCHEFRAQLYRTLGDYTAAEREAIDAQRFIERRLRRELLKHSDDHHKRDEAYRLSTIGTARVLGGLGRVAVLQGQLRRAEMLLRSARTLLRPTGQAALKLVVASHLAIAKRRMAEPGTVSWSEAMNELSHLYRLFADPDDDGDSQTAIKPARHSDLDGMRRCACELIRGFLDLAESRTGNRREPLMHADTWVEALESIAMTRKRFGHEPLAERYRIETFRALTRVFLEPPDPAAARRHVANAHAIRQQSEHVAFDLAGCDSIDSELAEIILLTLATPLDVEAIRRCGRRLLRTANRSHDAVLRGEVVLRWAIAEATAGHHENAARLVGEWEALRPFVDSASLERLQNYAIEAAHAGVGNSLSIPHAENMLYEEAMKRHGGVQAAAMKALNVPRRHFTKIRKRVEEQRRPDSSAQRH